MKSLNALLISLLFLSQNIFSFKSTIRIENSLKIMEDNIKNPEDSFFFYAGSDLDNEYAKAEASYRRIYQKSERRVDIEKGILGVDLDDNILKIDKYGNYIPSEKAGFPAAMITEAFREAIRKEMTILFLSSGLHTNMETIMEHICREFQLTEEEFRLHTDIIVGSKTFKSKHDKALALDYKLDNLRKEIAAKHKEKEDYIKVLSMKPYPETHRLITEYQKKAAKFISIKIAEQKKLEIKVKQGYINAVSKGKILLHWLRPLIIQNRVLVKSGNKKQNLNFQLYSQMIGMLILEVSVKH